MNTTELQVFRARLISAFTEYDRRESSKRHYNHNALGIYFARADDICADIAKGAEPRAAICAGLSDRLLNFILRKMNLTAPTNAECRGDGSAWHYVPASEGSV